MTRPAPLRATALVSLAAALFAGGLALPAYAQGTAEQREACAPDAVNLCQDTIPDVPKTTACMKRHFSELSPRCQKAFSAATGEGDAPPSHSARREAPEEPAPRPRYEEPGDLTYGYADAGDGLDTSRAVVARLCREGMIDPGTCRRTARILDMR